MADENSDVMPEPQEVSSAAQEMPEALETVGEVEPSAPAQAAPAAEPIAEPEVVVAEATVPAASAAPVEPAAPMVPEATLRPEPVVPAAYQPPPPAPPAPAYAPPPPAPAPAVASDKSKVAAGVLGILLGSLGIHKFYLGYNKEGIIMLLVSLLSFGFLAWVVSIIGIVEGIIYLTKTDEEFTATYVAGRKPWF